MGTSARKTKIKICGITSVEDGLMAAQLDVDALGFVFAPSKRVIHPQKAREIIKRLSPFITTVGVFMDAKLEEVKQISEYTKVDVIQLHGAESPAYCRRFGKRVIKRIAVRDGDTTESLIHKMEKYSVSAYLLDPGAGSGQTFDWEKAVGIHLPLIIAGGLTPENVQNVVRILRPYGVDVSSGVERSPGKKDGGKVKKFIEGVK